ncbi:glycosyltransferase family 4 protein [Novosphingobium sp. 1949]|uniref:Glycosyltransferase family 4 protein n=1 Tax=Novosphingobium organovorum TaxID=2930092 RepID=A0ABT0BDI7_9SPHN|nr:glycosyltransferase family 4 protein [Novosphingobium organovorum]MCJ2183127.1 glycosyltransferase family 4 protein [Novosphingobium organovorum]
MPNLLSMNSYHYRRGGSDVVYFDHAALFEEKGWNNTFFSMHHPNNVDTPDSRHFVSLVDYEFAQTPVQKARTALASIYNREARAKARQLLAGRQFDIAHAHCIYHHLTPSVFDVFNEAGVPIVLTAHDLKLACPAYKMMNSNGICEECKGGNLLNTVRNRCIKGSLAASSVVAAEAMLHRFLKSYRRNVTKIVAPSRFYRTKLIEWGWEEDRVIYIPNFAKEVDSRFTAGHTGNILYFGRLSEEKGLATLIRASARSGVAVDIAGTGPEREDLETLIAQVQAPVRLLGRLDGDALWSAVGSAKAVVLPSEWYENAPMSALEAMQLERPMIGADIGGIPELIRDSGGGLVIPSADASALADALSQIEAMPQERLAQMGQSAARYVRREFSRDRYFQRMDELYRECLRAPGGRKA